MVDVMAQDILNHGANVGNQELPLVCEEGTTLTQCIDKYTGMEITEKFYQHTFPADKYRKNLPAHHYFCLSMTVPDITTSENSALPRKCFAN